MHLAAKIDEGIGEIAMVEADLQGGARTLVGYGITALAVVEAVQIARVVPLELSKVRRKTHWSMVAMGGSSLPNGDLPAGGFSRSGSSGFPFC